ncbi:MAG: DUF742 domain-containing protein [Corynebacteriales bacterium]|nr:DUF742 domain-containing protein [Mycobacteriales bacterium]
MVRPFLDDTAQVAVPARAPIDPPAEIRPYLQTAGRVRPLGDLELEAQVVTTALGRAELLHLKFEQRDIVALCLIPNSVAEVAAKLHLHLSVARILAADIAAEGYLSIVRPDFGGRSRAETLERVIRGLEAIS